MAEPASGEATYDDLLRVPPPLVAEILYGQLHTHPRRHRGMRMLRRDSEESSSIRSTAAEVKPAAGGSSTSRRSTSAGT